MTQEQARRLAHERWGTGNYKVGDRCGNITRYRTSPLYRVGYIVRVADLAPSEGLVVMGSSDESWEAAFADADRRAVEEQS